MKKEIQNYNEDYKLDLNVLSNDPFLGERERLHQLYSGVSIEQMQTCKCKKCFDSGSEMFLYVNDFGEVQQIYALCTCDAIKNIVH